MLTTFSVEKPDRRMMDLNIISMFNKTQSRGTRLEAARKQHHFGDIPAEKTWPESEVKEEIRQTQTRRHFTK